jgi:hypothetical protein
MRVELPEDQWAELKEPGELRRADEKAVLRVSTLTIDPESKTAIVGGANDQDMEDAMLARAVKQWSFPFPLPCADPDSMGKLSIEQAHALAAAVKPHLQLITASIDPGKRDSDPTAG